MRGWIQGLLILSFLSGWVSNPTWAQVFQPDEERESAERGQAGGREALEAADEARQLTADTGRVRYEEVLAEPDNVELNYRFANTQVRDGDLKGAAATLERVLLLAPDSPRVRVFYAVVLYRLDDLIGANAELDRLEGEDLEPGLLTTVREYQRRIDRRRQRTRGAVSLSGGMGYDSNRNSAPHSDTLLIRDFRFRLGDGATGNDDYNYLGIGEFSIERDVGGQEQHTLFSRLTYYNVEQEKQEQFDVRSLGAEVGLRYRTQPVDWTFKLASGLVDLSAEKFVRNLAGEVRAERRLSPSTLGRLLGRLDYFDYDGIPDSPRAYQRTGLQTTLGTEFEVTLSPSHRSLISVGVHNRSADKRFYSYYGPGAGFEHTWLPGGGQFVIGSAAVDWNRYKDAQEFLSTKIRRELEVRTRVTYGAPLSFLSFGQLGGGLGEIVFSLSGEYLWISSNLPNFTYDNLKLGFLFTKRWEF